MKTPSIILALSALPWLASASPLAPGEPPAPPPPPAAPAPPAPASAAVQVSPAEVTVEPVIVEVNTEPSITVAVEPAVEFAAQSADLVLGAPPVIVRVEEKGAVESAPERFTWLGVAVDYVEPKVRAQLPIPAEQGLIVTAVPPDSPAAKAGLKEFDVLYKLDDQILITPEQLSKLVRSKKEGDAARLTVFRGGKEEIINAALATQTVAHGAKFAPVYPGENPGREKALQWLRSKSGDAPQAKAYQDMIERMRGMPDAAMRSGVQGIVVDNDLTIKISGSNGDQKIEVKGKDGKEIYAGPWNTPEDQAKAPEDVRKRLEGTSPGFGGGGGFGGSGPGGGGFGGKMGPGGKGLFFSVPMDDARMNDLRMKLGDKMESARDEVLRKTEDAIRQYEKAAGKLPEILQGLSSNPDVKGAAEELREGHRKLEALMRQLHEERKKLSEQQFELKRGFKRLQPDWEKHPEGWGGGGSSGGASGSSDSTGSSASMSVADSEGSVTRNIKDGVSTVILKDKSGKMLFEGPWNTEQDRAGAPKEVRERIERLMPENKSSPDKRSAPAREEKPEPSGDGKKADKVKPAGAPSPERRTA